MEQSWAQDAIRSFFGVVDRAVYGLVSTVYQIILDLSNTTILSNAVINDLYTRMYALLGIFMLFKVTFSFINYLINPDQFTDRAKGVQHLIKNVVIVLVMIIITPFAFSKLYEAQSAILSDQLIPRFILGVSGDDQTQVLKNSFKMSEDCANAGYAKSDGDFLALVTLRPFYQLENTAHTNDIFLSKYCPTNSDLTPSDYLNGDIYNKYTSSNIYEVDYKYFLSTIVGIVVCLVLVSFCFDIAVRSIKLAFLQILAPIPIISYIDPASSKNGMFSKWLKQVGSTWASLFVRLIALFFAVLIISYFNLDAIKNSSGSSHAFWVMLFVLIGALIFAKQLPKLLEELIPGLKLGGLQLNPFKKAADQALGGKQLFGLAAGALGFGLGSLSNLGSHLKDKSEEKKEREALADAQASYNRFKAHADAMRRSHHWSDDKYNKFLEQKYNQAGGVAELDKKLKDNQIKREAKFSYNHPFWSNVSQSLSGAKIAFNQGKNLKFDPVEIGKKSSDVRDYKDKYSVKDRTMDQVTDFFGIKNDSGTTSRVKEDLKSQNDLLTRINRNIEMQNKAFSDLQTKMTPSEFAKAVTMDAKGNYVLSSGYTGPYRNDLEAIIKTMASLETQRLATVKEINRLEKTRDQKPPKPSK